MSNARLSLVVVAVLATALSLLQGPTVQSVQAKPRSIVVPTDQPTIQAAIDAAKPRGTVEVLAGTYTEQIVITKDLHIVGAGMDSTVIRAPATLELGGLGTTSIVEIFGGASVAMSRLTVSGPGSGTCESGALRHGIRVHGEAHLDFDFGAVRNVHDTPMAPCDRVGTGIVVGQGSGPPASVSINHSEITNFQTAGLVVIGPGSRGNVTHNIVTGPGPAGGVSTDGIEFVVGAVGIIAHNTVSGNVCRAGSTICGPDFFTQFQHAGIVAGGNGPGTVVSHNLVFGNQVGMFLAESDEISRNVMIDNEFFGLALVGVDHGSFRINGAEISGGGGGLWVTAVLVDMTVALNKVRFSGLSGPAVEELECCGFTATVTGGP